MPDPRADDLAQRLDVEGLGSTGLSPALADGQANAESALEKRIAELTEELAVSKRQLASQIEERDRMAVTLRQMQRFQAVGQLTSGVAHAFNNMLTIILGNIAFIQRRVVGTALEEKVSRRLEFMEGAAERGATLTAQLLAFSRRRSVGPVSVDLNAVVDDLRDLLQSAMGSAVRLETVLSPELWTVLADPAQIELSILNLAINARDAMKGGGAVTVEIGNVVLREPPRHPEEPDPGEYVAVAVCDTGCGMTEEVRARAFEPFFTTKDVGRGTGLGLNQVLEFARRSGGGVAIDSTGGGGTTIRVFLPRAVGDGSSDRIHNADDAHGVPVAEAVILIVDDDADVREVTAAMLREAGYAVIEACSGAAGLEALDRSEKVDLLLVDFAMPGMNGAEVAREALVRQPRLPILFVTGYADLEAIRSVGEDRIIAKPFQFDRLLTVIEQTLAVAADRATEAVVDTKAAQSPR